MILHTGQTCRARGVNRFEVDQILAFLEVYEREKPVLFATNFIPAVRVAVVILRNDPFYPTATHRRFGAPKRS